ncbi:MAG: DUF494 family protein, partial [Rhodocyclaceae bacterium]|nr:DUF494 family protein [Rhodocyclaceae bacterium]
PGSLRIWSPAEQERLGAAGLGFIGFLESAGVLPPPLRHESAAWSVLHRLVHKAAMRLRSYALIAGALHLRVSFRQSGNAWDWRAERRFAPTADTRSLLAALETLWRQRPRTRAEPFAVGIALTQLAGAQSRSGDLFGQTEKAERLSATLDAINQRFGNKSLYFGGAHQALTAAPMRIAFQHIPDLELEAD